MISPTADFYTPFLDSLSGTQLEFWQDGLRKRIEQETAPQIHGKMRDWQTAISHLPNATPSTINIGTSVTVGNEDDLSPHQHAMLKENLRGLHPWRKGPFHLFGLHIDTEWRSDWKWDRLKDAIAPLAGKRVLDVGCGNGYHCWRMAGAGAKQVIGLDPMTLYMMQFQALARYAAPETASPVVLPMGIEHLPDNMQAFDTIFSMGVLYHRRSPIDHLLTLRDGLRSGGQLVLETLVVDGDETACLVPEGRYARMRNVWFLPSVGLLASWLRKCKFKQVELVDVTPTTTDEQRTTKWMTFESLRECLDPIDPSHTVEGHPSPCRAILTATRG